jgi:hypothetical protein
MKTITLLACDNCADGEVEYTVARNGLNISVGVKKCTSCGKRFGIKGVCNLRQIGKTEVK